MGVYERWGGFTDREQAADDHAGVVLAVGHQLVDAFDALPEVLGLQQSGELPDVLSLVFHDGPLRFGAVLAVGLPGGYHKI